MSTFRNPVGPQPARVYWRRRLVVGLGLLAVILVIVLIVVQPGRSETPPTSTDSAAEQPSTDATTAPPADSADPAAPEGACAPGSVTVTAVVDKTEYQPGELPQLSLTITNTGSAPCTVQAGSDVQEYIITSGSDRIWSSKDCQIDPVAAEQQLEPGVPVPASPFAWDRTRSSVETCDTDRPEVVGGGATYRLQVKVGEFESEQVSFLLF